MKKTSSNQSLVSSIGASPSSLGTADMSVFSRLYHAETAASRAQRLDGNVKWQVRQSTMATPYKIPETASGSRSGSATSSPRLEELYKLGEEKLRSRMVSSEDEAKHLVGRLEEEELKKTHLYTFRPQTKWNIIAERRQLARMELERAHDDIRRMSPKSKTEVRGKFRLHVKHLLPMNVVL
jgi:hypothetical protein